LLLPLIDVVKHQERRKLAAVMSCIFLVDRFAEVGEGWGSLMRVKDARGKIITALWRISLGCLQIIYYSLNIVVGYISIKPYSAKRPIEGVLFNELQRRLRILE